MKTINFEEIRLQPRPPYELTPQQIAELTKERVMTAEDSLDNRREIFMAVASHAAYAADFDLVLDRAERARAYASLSVAHEHAFTLANVISTDAPTDALLHRAETIRRWLTAPSLLQSSSSPEPQAEGSACGAA